MRVVLVCPAPARSRLGNRITALRWRSILAELGHTARIVTELGREEYDVLVALHAYKSAGSVLLARERYPDRPLVVALTGTDLSRDIHVHDEARRSLALADRLVVLHDRAIAELPRGVRAKARVIRQSADAPRARGRRDDEHFEIAFVAHLRAEKDPLRSARAASTLPRESRVRIVHAGRALDDAAARSATREAKRNARYLWLGEVTPARAKGIIARARAMVLTSVSEGGANVLGEAIVAGTPVIASRIPAAVSALGRDYRGFFEAGDTAALARLLLRAERDPAFLAMLTAQTRARRPLFARAAEKRAWRDLLAELSRRSRSERAEKPGGGGDDPHAGAERERRTRARFATKHQ